MNRDHNAGEFPQLNRLLSGLTDLRVRKDTIRHPPLVSVCISSFNHERYIAEAIESVLAQTYPNIEIIVLDDASSDATPAIVQNYARRFPQRIHAIFLEENEGPARGTNRTFAQARGTFVALLGSDDRMHPSRIEQQVLFLAANPGHVAVFTEINVIDSQGKRAQNHESIEHLFNQRIANLRRQLLAGNFLNAPSALIRKADLLAVGGYTPVLRYAQDFDLWGRLLIRGELAKLPQRLTEFRVHGANLSVSGQTEPAFAARCETVATIVSFVRNWPIESLVERPLGIDAERAAVLLELAGHLERIDLQYFGKPLLACALAYELTLQASRLDGTGSHALKQGLEVRLEAGSSAQRSPHGPDAFADGCEDEHAWSGEDPDATPLEVARMAADASRARTAPAPDFTVVIDARADAASLAMTLASLGKQVVRPDNIAVLCSEPPSPEASCDAIAYLTPSTLDPWIGQHCQSDHSWLICLVAGDVLAADACYQVRRAIDIKPHAKIVYFDHDELSPDGRRLNPHFKPDSNPDLLRSYPYTGRAIFVRGSWLASIRATAPLELASSYALALQAMETGAEGGLAHVPEIIAHLNGRVSPIWARNSVEAQAVRRAINDHVLRTMPGATVLDGPTTGIHHVLPPLWRTPRVSILVPTKDQFSLLKRCLESVLQITDYPDFEIIVVDNGSETQEGRHYLAGLESIAADRIRVLYHPGAFNVSAMNNRAAEIARGEYLLLLNSDTAALQADWLSHMMRHAMREDVGVVGAALFLPDGRIQHAGVVLGLEGPAAHPFRGDPADAPGYFFRAQVQQNYSAVTGACLLVRKSLYEAVGGLDETTFPFSYQDIDLCLKVRERGKLVVWTPLAMLLQESSASELWDNEERAGEMKTVRFRAERAAMHARWGHIIGNDPAYNPNLALSGEAFTLETNPLLHFDRLAALAEHRVVAFLTDTAIGRARYRIIEPLEAMKHAGLASGGILDDVIDVNLVLRSGAKTLVLQQPRDEGQLSVMEALIGLTGIMTIFDGDDLLWNLPFRDMPREAVTPSLMARMEQVARRCGRIVVSNERLARQMSGLNDTIVVTPDALNPAIWGDVPFRPMRPPTGRKLRAGWVADGLSGEDTRIIEGLVEELAEEIDWVCLGACPASLRPYIAECIDDVPAETYPSVLMAQDWDLALAPLSNSAHNECRSDVRLIEYAWCGFPVVCSDVPAYRNGLPTTRVANVKSAWVAAVQEHLANLTMAVADGREFQQHVSGERLLKADVLTRWYKAWTGPTT